MKLSTLFLITLSTIGTPAFALQQSISVNCYGEPNGKIIKKNGYSYIVTHLIKDAARIEKDHFTDPVSNQVRACTSNITDFRYAFSGDAEFNGSLGHWDTSHAYFMDGIFYNATSFNQPIGMWVTSNVRSFKKTFLGAVSFDQPLNNWDTSSALTLEGIFYKAESFNHPLDNWDVSNVRVLSTSFLGAKNFSQDLSSWKTSNVRSFYGVFNQAPKVSFDLSAWSTNSALDFGASLVGAKGLLDKIGPNWDLKSANDLGANPYPKTQFSDDIIYHNIMVSDSISSQEKKVSLLVLDEYKKMDLSQLNGIFNENLTVFGGDSVFMLAKKSGSSTIAHYKKSDILRMYKRALNLNNALDFRYYFQNTFNQIQVSRVKDMPRSRAACDLDVYECNSLVKMLMPIKVLLNKWRLRDIDDNDIVVVAKNLSPSNARITLVIDPKTMMIKGHGLNLPYLTPTYF